MASSQYQGSQAYNQSLQGNEYINKSTGSLVVSIQLAQLRGITDAIGLDLSLSFTAGSSGQLGLPAGWGFGIPFVANGQSLTVEGKTFVIDPSWSDSSGYLSGLKYLNDHGRRFETIVPPQPIPGGGGSYGFRLSYDDGSISYFDATGKLIAHADLYGNMLHYAYTSPLGDVFNNRLARISDSFGQVVAFGYNPNQIVVTLPDGATQTIDYSDLGVQRVTNQIGARTELAWIRASGQIVVGRIDYPTGLRTELTYTGIRYRDQSGVSATRPAVETRTRTGIAGAFLDQSIYSYGTASGGNTYTGYSAGYRLSPDSDGLMDSNNTAYLYDVLEQRVDANGTQIAASRVFFNFLHCPVAEHSYLIDASGNAVEAHRTVHTYDIVANMHARSVNMSKPARTVHSVFDSADGIWVDTSMAETTYDLFGKITRSRQLDLSSGSALVVSQRTHSYVKATWGGEMPARTEYLDAVTGLIKRLDYVLTSDQRSIEVTTVSTKPNGAGAFEPYKTKSFTYDGMGRLIGWTLAWAPGYSGEPGAVTAVSESIGYSYDAATHRLSHRTTDANGHSRTSVFDMSRPTAPCLSQTRPTGATRSFTYDALARVLTETDSLGTTSTHSYALASGGRANTTTAHHPNGYELRTMHDAKGRAILIEDNGDPTQTTPTLSRRLRQVSFNALDLKASETDGTGQTTTYAYDALGRAISVTDALGNVLTTQYNDSGRTISTLMNGDLRSVRTRDGLGNVIQVDTHADSASPQAGQVQRLTTVFDGFGQAVSETHASLSGGTLRQGSTKTFSYTPEGEVAMVTYVGTPEDAALEAQKVMTTQRDLNGNPMLVTREVSYAGDVQPSVVSETLTYDPVGNLISITNQVGQTETLSYTADSALATRTRYDGTQTSYSYDAAGRMLTETIDGAIRRFSYLLNGRVASISDSGGTVTYDYSLDGTASGITYADGKALTLAKDPMSRVVSLTLPDGMQSTYTYSSLNQMIEEVVGGVKLINTWGRVNHSNGVLTQQQLSGLVAQTTTLGYDGFGEAESIDVTDTSGAHVLTARSVRDGWRNLVELRMASDVTAEPSVNATRSMAYDGLKQLVSVETSYANGMASDTESFVYDGAANVLRRARSSQVESFTYNALNQLTSGGASYDANGRMTTDVTGARYDFDAADRLTRVDLLSGARIVNAYAPQGALSSVDDGAGEDRFYPLGGTMVSVAAGASSTSPRWSALMWSNQQPVARVSASAATAYAAAAGSVRVHRDSAASTALDISAYGEVTTRRPLDRANSFNWGSQYTDPASGLAYLRARWYSPGSMRFVSLDPRLTMNRYAYAMGNPIAKIDPLGQSWEEVVGVIVGAIVGITATVATGGAAGAAAAAVFGTESLAASISAGALAGAVGSVAGDMTNAGISGQKVTGARVAIDVLSGAVGGAVGAGAGGGAGRLVMRQALNAGWSQAAITRIGMVTSGAIGGLGGAAASGGVTSLAYHQPFFSTGNIINMAVGFGAGIGGGFLTSGAYIGVKDSRVIPVPIGENELHLITPARDTLGAVDANERLLVMAPQPEADGSAAGFLKRPGGYKYAMRLDFDEGNGGTRPLMASGPDESVDTIAAHGAGNTIFASVDISGNGSPDYVRPITGRSFSRYLLAYTDLGDRQGPIKLMSCFGAFRNARVIAKALGRDVWAGYSKLDRFSFTDWVRFRA